MAKVYREYVMSMIRTNPQTGNYETTWSTIACSKAQAIKNARNYQPIYGGMYFKDIISVGSPLIEGVDFYLTWVDTDTSHSRQVAKKLYGPDVDFIKAKMAEDEKYAKIYWDLKKEGRIK